MSRLQGFCTVSPIGAIALCALHLLYALTQGLALSWECCELIAFPSISDGKLLEDAAKTTTRYVIDARPTPEIKGPGLLRHLTARPFRLPGTYHVLCFYNIFMISHRCY